jgi:hypothetical protein
MGDRVAVALEPCGALRERPYGLGIEASRVVERSPEDIHAFIAELENHRVLTGRHLRLQEVAPGGRGGRIVMRGPLGVRRTAATEVTVVRAPGRFGGVAVVGPRTRARVDWTIEAAAGGGSRVELRAVVLDAGPLDRMLLKAGGRGWLRRRFRDTLRRLDGALGAA